MFKQSYNRNRLPSTNRQHPLTWFALTRLEPRLLILERELVAGRRPRGARLWQMYEAMKQRLKRLVGWYADSPHGLVTSSTAWELAICHLTGILERPRRRRRPAA